MITLYLEGCCAFSRPSNFDFDGNDVINSWRKTLKKVLAALPDKDKEKFSETNHIDLGHGTILVMKEKS